MSKTKPTFEVDKKGVEEAELDALLIHEFGHHFSMDHLSEAYHKALCKLGADLKQLALAKKVYRLNEF
jgi:hypothetical protein